MGRQKKWETSDTINTVSAAVNSIIAICTIVALYFSYQSMKISEKSLQLTKQTIKESDSTSKVNFDLTKRSVEAAVKLSQFADSNYSVTKKGIESSNRNYEHSYKISEKSFNETVSQFNKSNTPYIQTGGFKLSEIRSGSAFWVTSVLENITNIPVKILKQKAIVKIDKVPFDKNDFNKIPYQYESNNYLIKETFITTKTTIINDPITKEDSAIIKHKDFYVYIFRKVVYQNLVTRQIRNYEYQVKIKYAPNSTAIQDNTYVEYLYNENYDE
jgi:hypothetical protein